MDRDAVLDSVQDQVENHLQRMTAEDLVVRIPYGASAELKIFIAQWLVQSFPGNKVVCFHRRYGIVQLNQKMLYPSNVYYVKNN